MFELRPFERRNNHVAAYDPWDQMERAFFGDGSWGRGLSEKCTGASDRLHDCRARTVIEAIMWHGAAQSDARWSVEKFRTLSKDDRDAVVEFIESI